MYTDEEREGEAGRKDELTPLIAKSAVLPGLRRDGGLVEDKRVGKLLLLVVLHGGI